MDEFLKYRTECKPVSSKKISNIDNVHIRDINNNYTGLPIIELLEKYDYELDQKALKYLSENDISMEDVDITCKLGAYPYLVMKECFNQMIWPKISESISAIYREKLHEEIYNEILDGISVGITSEYLLLTQLPNGISKNPIIGAHYIILEDRILPRCMFVEKNLDSYYESYLSTNSYLLSLQAEYIEKLEYDVNNLEKLAERGERMTKEGKSKSAKIYYEIWQIIEANRENGVEYPIKDIVVGYLKENYHTRYGNDKERNTFYNSFNTFCNRHNIDSSSKTKNYFNL